MAITPQESKAARGLLDWSQADLAEASLIGRSTARNFENESRSTAPKNLIAIHNAFVKAGVIFESDRRYVGVKIRRGKRALRPREPVVKV